MRWSIFPFSACFLAAAAVSAASPLNSTFFSGDAIAPVLTSFGRSYPLIDSATKTLPRMTAHITTLNPGAAVQGARHHPNEEVILVKEGQLDVLLHGQTTRAGPGALIFLAANVMHNVTNVGSTPASYYVFDVYTPKTAKLPPEPADDWGKPGMLKSQVIDCERLPAKPTPQGSRKAVLDGPTATYDLFHCHLTTLNPGVATGLNSDPADEVIILQSGYLESFMKGVTVRMGPGSFYFQAAGDLHSLKNLGPIPATYLVLKWVATAP